MGRLLLVFRLATRDLRRRPGEATLLLLAITAATTTLTLGLVLRGITDKPYERTREATAGPDVVAGAGGASADLAGLKAVIQAPGVVGHTGPYPVVEAVVKANGQTVAAYAEGRDTAPAAIDQPKLTAGSWVDGGGVVIEAAFADALGVGAGDQITMSGAVGRAPPGQGPGDGAPQPTIVNGRSFRVAGVAVTAAAPPYPELPCVGGLCIPGGLVWLTEADARSLAPQADSITYTLNLKLADPGAAPAFVNAHFSTTHAGPMMSSWQDISKATAELVRNERRALLTGSWLLGLLAVASVAVLVGGRMADQIRRVGLLKAVGGTPSLVAAVLLAEYVVVALLAAAAGVAIGRLAAPLLTDPSAGLLGRAGAPPLSVSTVGLVTAVALGVAVAATFVPAIRAARTSTVRALADSARAPRRTAWLISLSRRLPVPLLLGLRVTARRPRRAVLAMVSIAITVSGIVAALSAHSEIGDANSMLDPARDARMNQVLVVLTVTLLALAAVNALFITWATALDARHSSAVARALGATPQQVSAGLSVAQVLPALVGAALGIPGGIQLINAVDPDPTIAPLWQLLAVVPATVLLVAVLTAIPARLGARRPVAEVLRSELA